jgi:hypothetical protein
LPFSMICSNLWFLQLPSSRGIRMAGLLCIRLRMQALLNVQRSLKSIIQPQWFFPWFRVFLDYFRTNLSSATFAIFAFFSLSSSASNCI